MFQVDTDSVPPGPAGAEAAVTPNLTRIQVGKSEAQLQAPPGQVKNSLGSQSHESRPWLRAWPSLAR